MVESAPVRSPGDLSDPQLEYRTIEPWAIAGLLLAVISPVALLAPLFMLFPPLGILVNLVALRRLRLDPHRIGRTAAVIGIGISTLFTAMPLARILTARLLLAEQARPIADQFFQYLREKSPEKAIMLEFAPDYRQPLDENLWAFFRREKAARDELVNFTADPTVRTLLTLGDRAQIRYYKTIKAAGEGWRGGVVYWYTVTYDDAGQKKTFLIRVHLARKPTQNPAINPWQIKELTSGINPHSPET